MRAIENKLLTVGLVVSLTAIGQLASSIYLPAMPSLSYYFQVPSYYIQYTCSAYILAFSCSQFIYGPLSDYFGRRIIILISLLIFINGSVLVVFAEHISLMILGCFIQGLGIGSSSALARSILRDISSHHALQKTTGYLSICLVIIPITGPLLGSYLQKLWLWQADFILLIILGSTLWVLLWRCLPETNNSLNCQAIKLKTILNSYQEIYKNRLFLAYTLVGLCGLAAEVSYELANPFLLQEIFHLSPVTYSWLNTIPFLGYILGSFISTNLQLNATVRSSLFRGLAILGCGGSLLLGHYYFFTPSIFGLIFPLALALLGLGIIFPSALRGAMEQAGSNTKGTAGAASSGLQNLGASIVSIFIALLPKTNPLPLAWVLITCAISAWALFITITTKI